MADTKGMVTTCHTVNLQDDIMDDYGRMNEYELSMSGVA